jgi:hypothetical protein
MLRVLQPVGEASNIHTGTYAVQVHTPTHAPACCCIQSAAVVIEHSNLLSCTFYCVEPAAVELQLMMCGMLNAGAAHHPRLRYLQCYSLCVWLLQHISPSLGTSLSCTTVRSHACRLLHEGGMGCIADDQFYCICF